MSVLNEEVILWEEHRRKLNERKEKLNKFNLELVFSTVITMK